MENAKEKEKLFRYTRELENVRDNVETLFENWDKLDDNEKEVEEYIKNEDKKMKMFTGVKWVGKVTTIAGGGLSFVDPKIGGGLVFSGSIVDTLASLKEKSCQESKTRLEIEKVKKITEKSVRDLNRLKDNWKKLDDISERLFWLLKTAEFSDKVNNALSVFLFEERGEVKPSEEVERLKNERIGKLNKEIECLDEEIKRLNYEGTEKYKHKQKESEKMIKELKKKEKDVKKSLKRHELPRVKPYSVVESIPKKLKYLKEEKKMIEKRIEEVAESKFIFQELGEIWEEREIKNAIDKLVKEVNNYYLEIFPNKREDEMNNALETIREEIVENNKQSEETKLNGNDVVIDLEENEQGGLTEKIVQEAKIEIPSK